MDYLRRLLSRTRELQSPTALSSSRLLSRTREQQRPPALSSSILNKVPLDILICIVDYLPPESAVAFSLSCMQLKCLLGTQHFLKVTSSTENTLALLNLLAFDLPNQVVCSTCNRLHNMDNLRRYNDATYDDGRTASQYLSLRFPTCVSQDQKRKIWVVSSLSGATAFKMVMKRYDQQPECTELLNILSSKIAKTMKVGDYVRQSEEQFRVVQGCLMHRLQSVYISLQRANTTPLSSDTRSAMICPHVKFNMIREDVEPGLKKCHKCCTEYRVDFKYYEGHGWAMFFTRWKALGGGLEDTVWEQHLLPSAASFRRVFLVQNGPQASARFQNKVQVWLQDGNLSYAFGDRDDFEFDSLLTSGNKAELFRFQKQC